MDKTILHCDMNNFYASVAQRNHPEYDGMPIAVTGNPEKRHGIVLAKNMIAKNFGVKTGEAIWEARQKCPDLICLPPDFEQYVKISEEVFQLYTSYTDRVERFGIDECWLDVTGCEKLFGGGETIANTLREEVKKRFGITISVGVSFTKVLAKLGSDLKKPDATTVLSRENYMQKIGKLPPSELIMIGKKTEIKLKNLNVRNIYELSKADVSILRQHFGIIADNMINAAKGIETEEVKKYYDVHIPKSISNGTTAPRDISNREDAKIVVYALAELIAVRMRRYNLVANGIALYLKKPDLSGFSKQIPLPYPTSNASDLAEAAVSLLYSVHNFDTPLRAVTVAAIRLENKGITQISLFDNLDEKEEKLEASVDRIRQKYGYQSVKRGVMLQNDLAVNLHDEDDFHPFKKN